MTNKKVLIIHATAGSGHTKSAQAIYNAINEVNHNLEVKIINSLDYTNTFFKFSYPRVYMFLVNRIPLIWGFFYYILDSRFFYPLLCWIRHIYNWLVAQPLVRFLEEYQPDIIINTHFLAPDVISMAGKKRISGRMMSVITDYRLHSFWIARGVDEYLVTYEDTKKDLVKRGIPKEKIKVFGMPIDPVFLKEINKDEIKRKLGIRNLFTVLVGSGGFGVGPMHKLIEELVGVDIPIQLLVVCGKNKELFKDVSEMSKKADFPVKAFGFVDNMHELMEVSDLIVTKSGGIVCAEALAKNLPIVGIFPIPGQESRNLRVMLEKGVAMELDRPQDAKNLLTNLFKDKDKLEKIRKNVALIRKPRAAMDIADFALTTLEKGK